MDRYYTSLGGGYEAVIPAEDRKKRDLFERMLSTTEDGLNQHLLNKHLPQPGLMSCLGFQFDAELAAFLGLNLDPVAEETRDMVLAARGSGFKASPTYQKMLAYRCEYETLGDLEWKLREFQYPQRIAAELGTLVRLGLVSDGLIDDRVHQAIWDAGVQPVSNDSFFTSFNVKPI